MRTRARLSPGLWFLAAPALAACGGDLSASSSHPDASSLPPALDASATEVVDANSPPESAAPSGAGADVTTEPGAGGSLVDGSPEAGDAATFLDARGDDEGSEGMDGLPSTAECLTGGHVLWVEGDPGCFWFAGTQLDSLGSSWSVEAEAYYAVYDGALLEVQPPASADAGGSWYFNFNTWNLREPMQTGVVYDALAASGSYLVGYVRTCSSAYGSFRVDEFNATGVEDGGGM